MPQHTVFCNSRTSTARGYKKKKKANEGVQHLQRAHCVCVGIFEIYRSKAPSTPHSRHIVRIQKQKKKEKKEEEREKGRPYYADECDRNRCMLMGERRLSAFIPSSLIHAGFVGISCPGTARH